ncbi:MAG: double-strand break repair helicase AddA [Pseudotabrizicola sp.]|uniref:double-strand break repair helicase AddA n=1 Tax=Pseudotabrizicola sp. TaxID=2939647 RepID=UPI00271E106F|nr:double-strand break repair helicase AddA [Pseudotabrizicola sp.]MDO9639193.1 double-strand break repair helicase AddA [Pseudotabrizicola sp.]
MTHDASLAQMAAAQPALSTWLSANAGSGKTRVLTDRVARLLLNKVQPQHILCLTYTKAAATEMQNRLFRRLGEWAMKPDDALRADLTDLGEGDALDAGQLALARQLFARAIETPGGLRIQTIHSFCATLLRRYPLEAGVTPGFKEMDDRTARTLRDDIVQDMADRLAPAQVATLARHYTAEDFGALMNEICIRADDFARPLSRADALARFDQPETLTLDRLLASVFLGDEGDILAELTARLAGSGVNDQKAGNKLAALDPFIPDLRSLQVLEGIFLFGSGARANQAKLNDFPAKDLRNALGPLGDRLQKLMGRVEGARAARVALEAAEKTLALHDFARVFLGLYTQRKADRGFLDFDDLIRKAGRLLNDPGLAAWVLFRLDGGIDHILVDEAQDTSPAQWRVIEKLTAEFTAGRGASDKTRTLFVVGDKKQSIYSFQGADLSAFEARRQEFGAKFAAIDQPMQDRTLDYSFRSSRAVLDVVDATFGNAFPAAMGDPPRHVAFFDTLPGRVDLWPLIPKADTTADEDGWNPVDLISDSHHTVELARLIAAEIRAMIDAGVHIPTAKGESRPVQAGDVLILVQTRGTLFSQIIRACKQAGLPIAGADRLKLGEELAVKDLVALLSFVATPEDSLSLAAALRSPLFGWSEDRLFRLAHGRADRHLWASLRNTDAPDTLPILNDLRSQADFLRPYEMLERILTRHKGRQRLLTRLGPEAEDGIDELLNQALAYESNDVPSLTGFLTWLESDVVEVKRQLDSEGSNIRVMTVHGSKGLEAPIVILPDTADRSPRDHAEVIRLADGLPVWKTAEKDSPPDVAAALDLRKARIAEENLRLLYVALTRARSWLIVAGAGEAKIASGKEAKPREKWAWHRQVEAGLNALGARADATGRLRHQVGLWPANGLVPVAKPSVATLPGWVATPAPDAPRDLAPLSPSDLGGAKALPGEGDPVDVAKARGTALHRLLETLPALDRALWPATARALTPAAFDPEAFLSEAAAVLSMPEAAALFARETLAEVSVTATLHGQQLAGTIDRVVLTPDHVLVVDFKTNRVVPDTPDLVPESILRQLGAYAHAMRQIYPDRQIETAILWTAAPKLMYLDPEAVTAALGRAPLLDLSTGNA